MEELFYSKLQNYNTNKIGGGLSDMFSESSPIIDNLPYFYTILGTCTLSMYLCSNSKKIFKKTTEEYFIFLWIGVIMFGSVLAYLQVNQFLLALPPFVGPGIYIALIIVLILSCFFSM